MYRRRTYTVIGGVLCAWCLFLLGGCTPSRSAYFEKFRKRQAEQFSEKATQTDLASLKKEHDGEQAPLISGELPLADAARYALALNPQLEATLKKRMQAEGRKLEAYSEALPKLDAQAGYTRLHQLRTVNLGTRSFQVGEKDNYSFTVRLTQPLYKGGAMVIAQRAAALFTYLQDELVRGQVQNVLRRVADAYYSALLAKQLIEVQKTTLEAARAHYDAVKSNRKQGTATRYDVLRARVEVANYEARLLEQKNQYDTAKATLLRTMGVSQNSEVTLVTDFEFEPQERSFSKAARTAFKNRPDIYRAGIAVDLQSEDLRRARSRYLPRIHAFFEDAWSRPDPFTDEQDWGDEKTMGIQLEWPLFAGLGREGRVTQARARLEEKRKQRRATRQKALLEVRNALNELQNAVELVKSQELNVERAKEAHKLLKTGYREGVNTEVEILDATAALTEAKGQYYEAMYKYTMARIRLQDAMGVLGPSPGSTKHPQNLNVPEALRPSAEKKDSEEK